MFKMYNRKRKKSLEVNQKSGTKQLSLLSFFSSCNKTPNTAAINELFLDAVEKNECERNRVKLSCSFEKKSASPCKDNTEDKILVNTASASDIAAPLTLITSCTNHCSEPASHDNLCSKGYNDPLKELIIDDDKLDSTGAKRNKLSLSSEELQRKRKHRGSQVITETQSFSEQEMKFYESSNVSRNVEQKNSFVDFMDIENLGDLFEDDWSGAILINDLSLNEWKYCVVNKVEQTDRGLVISLQEQMGALPKRLSTKCLVKGYWGDVPLKCNDIVSIKACFNFSLNLWYVDDTKGCIVKHPDILISGTSLVGSLFCQRQSVLNYLFPGLDSSNLPMLAGSVIHELLQEVLKRKAYTENDVRSIAENLLRRPRMILSLYECSIPSHILQKEIDQIVPEIIDFINVYLLGKTGDKMWNGKITKVISTEENFWIPSWGIKGKTDFIVETEDGDETRIMPLELKTGRATNSIEHRGQIILYLLMMTEVGLEARSGLLLYLKHNVMKKIEPYKSEQRGLITIRNNLIDYYLANGDFEPANEKVFIPRLPEPINHPSACSKCSYLKICSAYLNKEKVKLVDSNPLKNLSAECLSHLSARHLQYVFQWLRLLKIEEIESKKSNFSVADIWRMTPEDRQNRGCCISKLEITDIRAFENKFLYEMKYSVNKFYDLTTSNLTENDYIVVSTDKRVAIATGFVYSISNSALWLKIEKELDKCANILYAVDKYTVNDPVLKFNSSSILSLLDKTDSAARLRRLVIDLELPHFSSAVNFDSINARSLLQNLNECQRKAVSRSLAAEEYLLIRGLPGTGKTATIATLIRLLVKLKYSVLVTSHTHSAVDNILLRLKGKLHFLRLGSPARVHAQLQSFCEDRIIDQCAISTAEQLENFYNQQSVIAVTCMGCFHPLISKRVFDYCIVDEATQVLQPSILKCLSSAKKFILVGDPNQLAPVVQSEQARRLGFSESLFLKLYRPEVTTALYMQYRMNAEIMKLANLFAYDNLLECDDERIRSATIDTELLPKLQAIRENPWLSQTLSNNIKNSVIFLNTSKSSVNFIHKYANQKEANVAFIIIEWLIKCTSDIGIIAPYREQVKLLRKMARERSFDVEINTVDQFQGRDKDAIIYSCTTECTDRNTRGILSDKRRLTVAITRAKRKLIIIGNVDVLKSYSIFENLIDLISCNNLVDITT